MTKKYLDDLAEEYGGRENSLSTIKDVLEMEDVKEKSIFEDLKRTGVQDIMKLEEKVLRIENKLNQFPEDTREVYPSYFHEVRRCHREISGLCALIRYIKKKFNITGSDLNGHCNLYK